MNANFMKDELLTAIKALVYHAEKVNDDTDLLDYAKTENIRNCYFTIKELLEKENELW